MPVQLTIKAQGAELVRQGLEDVTAEIPRIGRKRIYEATRRAQAILRLPKSRPRYPIRWVSERQRRAFFASDGFGRGIPSSRSGRSLQWEISPTGNGYTLFNSSDYSRYLYGYADGSGQSQIFDADYPLFRDVVENEIENLPEDIKEHISYYCRGKGF